MKRILLLPVLLLLPGASQAQRPVWSVGLLGSYGHYKFNPAERQFGQYQLHIYGMEPMDMWRLGVFARKPLGRADGAWYVQAELDRSGRNAHAQLENLAPEPSPFDFELSSPGAKIRRYDLTALLGVPVLRSPVRLLGGPVVSYMSRRELLRDNYNWHPQSPATPYRRIEKAFYEGFPCITAGAQLGVGLELWRVSLDFRREWNITPVVGEVRWEGQNYRANVTSRLWMVTMGVRLWDKERTAQMAPAQDGE
ncbi:hypothetical protein J7E24_04110 [Hymenobacter sp. ISL-91]|uniref:hypothetical protein n=1 Tax=Hymenobacter sp. ISL-91 TaxID=2819151 RepID=UPI001BE777B7|nr:hypothetical protein [Hymenobacter sp. ISL-91]MBT2556956.1 hypothetical protein [Hymenobacter sp. ISL-91]